MKRFKLKRPKDTKTVSQLIQSLQTDNKDVDAILQAARLQRIERQERACYSLKIFHLVALTILLVTVIVCSFLCDQLFIGVSATGVILYIVVMANMSM